MGLLVSAARAASAGLVALVVLAIPVRRATPVLPELAAAVVSAASAVLP
jgi:hypothetical protein